MSTTRWIIETPCEHGRFELHHPSHGSCPGTSIGGAIWCGEGGIKCKGAERLVVDPANLPPEAIQRAAKRMAELTDCAERLGGADFCPACGSEAEEIVRAFLSDPEQGDQPQCDHNWVSARNGVIASGEICTKCHAIRAEKSTTPITGKETPTT